VFVTISPNVLKVFSAFVKLGDLLLRPAGDCHVMETSAAAEPTVLRRSKFLALIMN